MNQKTAKFVVGSVLIDCVNDCQYDNSLLEIYEQLKSIYSREEIDLQKVEKLHKKLISTANENQRNLGFGLEPLISFNPPARDWRDLAIEMLDTEISLFDLFYRLETSKEKKYESHDLLDWLNSVGSSVNYMRSSDWINAKKYANRALVLSKSKSNQKITGDEYLGEAIKIHQKDTKKYYEETIKHPVNVDYPEDRLDLILELQTIFLELNESYELKKQRRVLADVILYPIEKIGTAISYLMNSKMEIERANYEIGLACEHLKWKIPNLKDTSETAWANSIYENLEIIFSRLPANPWPVKGFGDPGVESRFKE